MKIMALIAVFTAFITAGCDTTAAAAQEPKATSKPCACTSLTEAERSVLHETFGGA